LGERGTLYHSSSSVPTTTSASIVLASSDDDDELSNDDDDDEEEVAEVDGTALSPAGQCRMAARRSSRVIPEPGIAGLVGRRLRSAAAAAAEAARGLVVVAAGLRAGSESWLLLIDGRITNSCP